MSAIDEPLATDEIDRSVDSLNTSDHRFDRQLEYLPDGTALMAEPCAGRHPTCPSAGANMVSLASRTDVPLFGMRVKTSAGERPGRYGLTALS